MRRDHVGLIGGVALIAVGLWYAHYASAQYSIGSLRRMGPGFFPTSLGFLMAGVGALIALPALFRGGPVPGVAWRAGAAILLAITVFALTVERTGLIPATLLLVGIAALAERKVHPVRTAILGIALSAMAVLVFSEGLGIPIPAVRWNI